MTGLHAIILAAGRSDRMGREKAALPWLQDQTLLEWSFDALETAGWSAIAVVRPEHLPFWLERLPQGQVIDNPGPERGKVTSLTEGIRHLPANAKWILLAAVDQPRPTALYRRLLECTQTRKAEIFVPDLLGHRGHPVVISGSFREKLLTLTEANHGLRGLLDQYPHDIYRLADIDPDWLQWDLNSISAYEDALAFFSSPNKRRFFS